MLIKWNGDLLNPFSDLVLDNYWKYEGVLHPTADVHEDKEKITVEVELPGVESDNISITLDKNVLNIKGEKVVKKSDNGRSYWKSERFVGSFSRSFTLPSFVETENIQASYDNGVLKINIPKKPEVVPRKIEVKSTG